jgi:ABC-type lipoprotein export system ATPase subunit
MIRLEKLSKVYSKKSGDVKALFEVDLHVKKGEFVVMRGPSGSGKTTLLLTVGGMLCPTAGRAIIGGNDLYSISTAHRNRMRAKRIGFVFQMFHLIPYLTVKDNVMLAANRKRDGESSKRVDLLLERFSMTQRANHKPAELSAGERQRVAIARAMFHKPELILADEPTGNLDPENATQVISYLSEFRQQGGTVLIVTHGASADSQADRILRMRDGRIESNDTK